MATLSNVPLSATARHHFQQYLSQLPSSSSTTSSSSRPTGTDLNTLLQRSSQLTQKVDALHSQLSDPESTGANSDDPQVFWSTITLQTNLRSLSARLQRHTSDRKAADALAKTQQNVDIVESLLRLISVSGGAGGEKGEEGLFTAPVKPPAPTSTVTTGDRVQDGQERDYEYWKRQTLSALNDDDLDTQSTFGTDKEDVRSDTDSILTDPDIHLSPQSTSTPLAGLSKEEEEEFNQYEKAPKPTYPPPTSTAAAPGRAGGDTTILQSDRATHEALSSELLRMASILKSNSLAFADSLERDRLLLEKAGTDLTQNLDLMTRTRGRLGVYSKKARSMGWFTLSAILVVVISWMLMFLLIRLT